MVRFGRRSAVWRHFVKIGEKTVLCTLCKGNFCYYGNTSNLRGHLKRKHSLLISQPELKNSDEIKDQQTDPNTPSVSSFVQGNHHDSSTSNSANESLDSEGAKQDINHETVSVDLMDNIPERKRKKSRSNSPAGRELNSGRKFSDIWNYCKDYKDGKATCLACNRQISCASTSNFKDHLERRHPHIKLKSKKTPYKFVQVDMSSFGVTDSLMDPINPRHDSGRSPLGCTSHSDEEKQLNDVSPNGKFQPTSIRKQKTFHKIPDDSSIQQTFDIDECKAYGTSLAIQLHQLADDQRFIAEKLMSDVIYFARFGKLTDGAHVELPRKNPQRVLELNDADISKQMWKINGETFYIANDTADSEN